MSRPSPKAITPAIATFADDTGRGITVRIRVTAGARSERIEGISLDPDGRARLAIAVRASANRGQANAAVIALLAREWKLPRTSLTVVAGGAARRKTIAIAGDRGVVAKELAIWASRRSSA